MVRSRWIRTVFGFVAWTGIAVGQQPTLPPEFASFPEATPLAGPSEPVPEYRKIQSWKNADGSTVYQMQSQRTGKMMTLVSPAAQDRPAVKVVKITAEVVTSPTGEPSAPVTTVPHRGVPAPVKIVPVASAVPAPIAPAPQVYHLPGNVVVTVPAATVPSGPSGALAVQAAKKPAGQVLATKEAGSAKLPEKYKVLKTAHRADGSTIQLVQSTTTGETKTLITPADPKSKIAIASVKPQKIATAAPVVQAVPTGAPFVQTVPYVIQANNPQVVRKTPNLVVAVPPVITTVAASVPAVQPVTAVVEAVPAMAEPLVMIQDSGSTKPTEQFKVLKTFSTADGSIGQEVQSLSTGETMIFVRPAGTGEKITAVPLQTQEPVTTSPLVQSVPPVISPPTTAPRPNNPQVVGMTLNPVVSVPTVQPVSPVVAAAPAMAEPFVTIQEPGSRKPPEQFKVLKTFSMADGSIGQEVQSLSTGETMTLVRPAGTEEKFTSGTLQTQEPVSTPSLVQSLPTAPIVKMPIEPRPLVATPPPAISPRSLSGSVAVKPAPGRENTPTAWPSAFVEPSPATALVTVPAAPAPSVAVTEKPQSAPSQPVSIPTVPVHPIEIAVTAPPAPAPVVAVTAPPAAPVPVVAVTAPPAPTVAVTAPPAPAVAVTAPPAPAVAVAAPPAAPAPSVAVAVTEKPQSAPILPVSIPTVPVHPNEVAVTTPTPAQAPSVAVAQTQKPQSAPSLPAPVPTAPVHPIEVAVTAPAPAHADVVAVALTVKPQSGPDLPVAAPTAPALPVEIAVTTPAVPQAVIAKAQSPVEDKPSVPTKPLVTARVQPSVNSGSDSAQSQVPAMEPEPEGCPTIMLTTSQVVTFETSKAETEVAKPTTATPGGPALGKNVPSSPR